MACEVIAVDLDLHWCLEAEQHRTNQSRLEAGYFSLSELKSIKGPFGLGIERDMHWQPRPLTEVAAYSKWSGRENVKVS